MVRNFNETNLAPNVRTIGVAGGTGDGKSEIASAFGDLRAKKIISKSVGETNSTLKERRLVYSESLVNEIILAVRLRDQIYEREDFNNMIAVNVSKVVREYGKDISVEPEKIRKSLLSNLQEEILTKVNSRAVLSFLTQEEIENITEDISDIFTWEGFFNKNSYEIYNKAKNSLGNQEVKPNSTKFFAAIRSEVEKAIDLIDQEILQKMWGILSGINESLKRVFFSYFSEEYKSNDGYYYHVINLDNQDASKEVVAAMFTSNNLRKGEKLSIEVFCSEIVIYAPMHKKVLEMIKSNPVTHKVFMGKDGKVSIGIYDTRGLYHENSTDEVNFEYFTELLYSINYDALMLVCPFSGDSNEAKLRELYTNAMKQYNKQVPIFMLNNKVDLFIDAMYKELSSDDPLSLEVSNEELKFDDVKNRVNKKMEAIRNELLKVQHKNRKNAEIISLPCYLKKDRSMTRELLEEYNVANAINTIVNKMAKYLEASSEKIPFTLSNIYNSRIVTDVNEEKVSDIIQQLLKLKETDNKVLTPAFNDISDNIGKVPHGNAYNALRRRLRNGYGYTSNIDENYFHNCNSFSINFTGMIRNIITDSLISKLFDETLQFEGGDFKDSNGKERLKDIILKFGYLNSYEFVAEMMYYKASENAEKQAFSYEARFKSFLNNCIPYFNKANLDTNSYTEAIVKILIIAVNRAIDLHILYV